VAISKNKWLSRREGLWDGYDWQLLKFSKKPQDDGYFVVPVTFYIKISQNKNPIKIDWVIFE
jgi:hypothetical protein